MQSRLRMLVSMTLVLAQMVLMLVNRTLVLFQIVLMLMTRTLLQMVFVNMSMKVGHIMIVVFVTFIQKHLKDFV